MHELKCPGVGRDKDCAASLQFYFNRPVTNDEMRFLHEVMQRTVACVPKVEATVDNVVTLPVIRVER